MRSWRNRESSVGPRVHLDQFPFAPTVEKAELKIRDPRLTETRSTERIQHKDGALNPTSVICLTEESILRSKKRRNSGVSGGSVQDSLASGYSLYAPRPVCSPFLIFNNSQEPEDRRKKNENGRQNGKGWVDGYVSSRVQLERR